MVTNYISSAKVTVNGKVVTAPELAIELDEQVRHIQARLREAVAEVDEQVETPIAEQGVGAREQREKAFFELAERFRAEKDPEQVKRLGDELGRMAFGRQRDGSAV